MRTAHRQRTAPWFMRRSLASSRRLSGMRTRSSVPMGLPLRASTRRAPKSPTLTTLGQVAATDPSPRRRCAARPPACPLRRRCGSRPSRSVRHPRCWPTVCTALHRCRASSTRPNRASPDAHRSARGAAVAAAKPVGRAARHVSTLTTCPAAVAARLRGSRLGPSHGNLMKKRSIVLIQSGCVAIFSIALQSVAQPGAALEPAALDGYRRWADAPPSDWRAANATVGRMGGWRSYAREAAGGQPAAPGAAASTPGGRSVPSAAPAAPAPSHGARP